jgi:hypothetical protein
VKLTLLVLTVSGLVQAQQTRLPSFDEYKVSEVFSGKPAAPRLTTAFARNFATAIREGAARGPNFAGNFSIVQWGCGTECIQMAVINEKNGSVSRGPFVTLAFSPQLIWHGNGPEADRFEPVSFQLDSRLLVVRGCPEENEKDCAFFYYEWGGKNFRLLQKLIPPPPPRF